MTQQMELGAYARRTDPATSHAAAESVKGSEASRMESLVLGQLRDYPNRGLTTHEIAEIGLIPYESVTPRIKPLVKKGLVIDSGERRIPAGRTKAGIVWRAV